jgi:hypothetical protein
MRDVDGVVQEYLEMRPQPPVDIEEIARLRACRIELSDLPTGASGLLVPLRGGYVLKISVSGPNVSLYRRRFTIAHEIAHTFFYRFRSDRRPEKLTGALSYEQEEMLCHLAAGRMLIPPQLIRKSALAKVRNASTGMVLATSKQFRVSWEVAARRLKAECSTFEGVGLCEWLAEDLYLRTRRLRFSRRKECRPLVLTWMIPPEQGSGIDLPRGVRVLAKSPIWELCSGQLESVEGAEMAIGAKHVVTLGEAKVYRGKDGYKPVRVLATISGLRRITNRSARAR